MKIYTKTGDEGTTGLFAGPRVLKDHARIEACGTVDELNAAIGVARAAKQSEDIDSLLARVQNELFAVGAELATPKPKEQGTDWISSDEIRSLEQAIDVFDGRLEPLRNFILPAGSAASASLHLARAICRRAERRVITFSRMPDEKVSLDLVIYLNRLGDLLFVLSRAANVAVGLPDVAWQKPSDAPRG